MSDLIVVIICVLSCMSTFGAGFALGIAYAIKTKAEGEKDE